MKQKLKNIYNSIKQKFKKNSKIIKSFIKAIVTIFIIYFILLLFSINTFPFFMFFLILFLICNTINIITYKELKIEEYFISDKSIYDRVNKNKMVENSNWLCLFIVTIYIISILTYKFVSVYDVRLLDSVVFLIITFIIIFIISLMLTYYITSYIFEYDFTIKYTFVKSEYRGRVWIYLRNRTEVLKRIANDKKLFKIREIKKQNSKLVSFSELELVKKEIKKLTTKQLEFILFKDKLPVFNKNNILTKRVLLSVGAIVVFFGQDIKNLVLNIIKWLIQYFSIEKIIQIHINNINMNLDWEVLFLSVIILFLYIIIPTSWLLKKIIIFFLNYRQTTIDDYLNRMIEEELKNRKERLKIKLYFKNKIEISD